LIHVIFPFILLRVTMLISIYISIQPLSLHDLLLETCCRHEYDIIVPLCRLSLTRDSFVPATLREWNSLNLSMCNLDILSKFKKAIRSSTSLPIPRHYYYGPKKLNIILTQLRCNASFLNYDWCKVKILSNASCKCGAPWKNSCHFFFDCDKYIILRFLVPIVTFVLLAYCLLGFDKVHQFSIVNV
jgi:hypothetical protein